MFTGNEYLYGWLFYLGGTSVVIGAWWYLTRKIPWAEFRYMLRLLLMAFFLVPWYSSDKMESLSPAWIMAIFEALFEGQFWRAGMPLVAVLCGVVALSLVYWIGRALLTRNTAIARNVSGTKNTSVTKNASTA